MIFEKKTTGFVGINIGYIEDSCSQVHMRNVEAAGFCIRNTGCIQRCFYEPVKNVTIRNGFCNNVAKLEGCFYLRGRKNDQEALDAELGIDREEVESFVKENEWDMENIWQWGNERLMLRNQEELVTRDTAKKEHLVIYTEKDLKQFVDGVNCGNSSYNEGNIILDRDIEWRYPEWIPIGNTTMYPFMGTFDGHGHRITGFSIRDKSVEYPGFFGICKNATIRNLTVRGRIVSKMPCAGFVNMCEDSIIEGCTVIINMRSQDSGCGFVYKNTGEIRRCRVSGVLTQQFVFPIH